MGLFDSLGFQQSDPNNPFQQQTPGTAELILRLAQNLGPLAHYIGGTRTPLGRSLGAGSVLAGGLSGTAADLLQQQRMDPLAQQARLAAYLQKAGTTPTGTPSGSLAPFAPTAPPDAANMSYAPVTNGQPSGFPGVASPGFDINALSPAMQMMALKAFPKLDPSEALKDEYLKANIEHVKQVTADLKNDPFAKLATNLPNRLAAMVGMKNGVLDPEVAAQMLERLRTNPTGPEARRYDFLLRKFNGDEEAAWNQFTKDVGGLAATRGENTEGGRITARNTPAAATAAANVAAGTETGKLSVLSSPAYIQNQADIAAARATATRQNARMSPQQVTQNAHYTGIENNLDTIAKSYKPEYVGGIPSALGFQTEFDSAVKESMTAANDGKYQGGAIIGRLRQYWGKLPAEQIRLYQALADNADRILRARSGAQINEKEAARLLTITPNASDMPAVFESKFAGFSENIMKEHSTMLEGITASPENIRRGLPTAPPRLGNRPITPANPKVKLSPAAQKYLDDLEKK